jgi:IS5 family transposase
VIGHLKQDNGMGRCWLQGAQGDAINAVLAAAGFNLRWLLRAIAARGLQALCLALSLLLALWDFAVNLRIAPSKASAPHCARLSPVSTPN